MPDTTLCIKLEQLDCEISSLRDQLGQISSMTGEQRDAMIRTLRSEISNNQQLLRDNMKYSHAKTARILFKSYDQVEQIICQTKEQLKQTCPDDFLMTQSAESKLLRAEYGLDFAVQTAERALLAALEALAAEEKELNSRRE